jgi:hypothetical protein
VINSQFGQLLKRTPRAGAMTSSMSTSSLATGRGETYKTGLTEEAVDRLAVEDGQAGSLDPMNVGKNSYPYVVEQLVECHEGAASVISYDLRDEVQSIDEELNYGSQRIDVTEAFALEAINEHTSALRQWLVQGQRMRASGVPNPARKALLILAALVLALFVGDWDMLAVGFQVMGLSDQPWIPHVPFTDELHFAALSSVVALVFLGHVVGSHIRRIQHSLELRRQAGLDADEFPKPATFDYVWALGAAVLAIGGMFALSAIRAAYLAAMHTPVNFWAFTGVQLLILAAAVGIGFAHANPEATMWRSVETTLAAADARRTEAIDRHAAAVGDFNSLIDRRLAAEAKAGHHVDADGANARSAITAYKRRYILAQLEPAQEQLFTDDLEPHVYDDGELLKRLTGVKDFPEFSKFVSETVKKALADSGKEISTLRARIDQIEIDKLELPDVPELAVGATVPTEQPATTEAAAAPSLHPVAPENDDSSARFDDSQESA